MKVILLDFDGVLNHVKSKSRVTFEDGVYVGLDKNKLRNLAKIVQETDAKIVLTTTWRDHYEVGAYKQSNRVGKYVNNKFRDLGLKIYDKIEDGKRFDRGKGAKRWLDAHPEVTEYVAIDDEDMAYMLEWDTFKDHFVKTLWDGNGLTENCANAAIRILNGCRENYIDMEDMHKIYPWVC